MPTIGKVRVRLDGDTRGFQRSMRGAERRVAAFSQRMSGLRVGIAAVAGGLGFGLLIRRTADEALRAQQLADRLGTSTEAFSKLSRVMARSGIQMNQMATMVQRMLRRASEAAAGNAKLGEAFAALGIDVDRFIQLDPVEAFTVLGRALAGVENNADRVRMAFQILDSEGVQALQLNLENLNRELARTRGISDTQAEAITRMAESWDRVKEAASAAFLTIGEQSGAFGAMERIFTGLTAIAEHPREFLEYVKGQIGRGFGRAARALGFTQFEPREPPPITAPMTGIIGGAREFRGGDLTTTNRILLDIKRNTSQPTGAVAQ